MAFPSANGESVPIAGGGLFSFTGQNSGWFGPGLPPSPVAQEDAEGRAFDFASAINLQMRTRAYEGVSFSELRNLADAYDLLRLAIETRKDQMDGLDWAIKGREKTDGGNEARKIQAFLQSPDRENTWHQWLRILMEDLLVVDAPSIYVRRTVGGAPFALEIIDGTTIKRVLDSTGRTPMEGTAYQQILKGVTAVDYTRQELIYMPRNLRSNRIYGYSPVEQIISTVNIALRRQMHQLSYYTEGSVPNLIFRVPKEWNPDQIQKFQTWWDSLRNKRGARFVPDGVEPIDTKAGALKDEYDEWLARIVAFAFSLSPQALVKQVNRATAESAQEEARMQGLDPIKNWFKGVMDRILRDVFQAPHLEFDWVKEDALDPVERANVHRTYVESGILRVDEVRDDLGKDPMEIQGEAVTSAPAGEAVQDTALNGAQVASLLQIVQAAATAGIPKETARAMVRASFPALSDEVVNAIVNPIEPEKPAAPVAAPPPPPIVDPKEEEPKPEPSLKLAKAAKLKPIKRDRPAIKKLQAKIEKAVSAFFKAQAKPIASSVLIKARVTHDLQKMSLEEALQLLSAVDMDWSALGDDLEPILAAIAQDGGSAALAQIGKTTADLLEQVNEKAVAWAETHAAELVTRISEVTREKIAGDVATAIEMGLSVDELADALSSSYAFSPERAELIAQTERAFADVRGNTLGYAASGVVGGLEWITANAGIGGDDRTCEDCDMNNGAVVGMDENGLAVEPFPSGATAVPAHPGCFVSGTVVSAVGVSKHFKRWFAGEVVTLSIEGNDDLTATPHHPILTRRGWVAAAELQQGDEVVKCLDPRAAVAILGPDDHHIETRIEEMADALAMAGRVSSARVPTAPEDFHGDGLLDQEVDVIWAKVGLGANGDTSATKSISEIKLEGALVADPLRPGDGAANPEADGLSLTSDGGMRSLSAPHALGRACDSRFDETRLCERPNFGAVPAEHVSDREVMASVPSSDACGRLSVGVGLADGRDLRVGEPALKSLRPAIPTDGDAVLGEDAVYDLLRDSKLLGELVRRGAGLVTTAKVQRVTRNEFAGHVFNLQTVDGWYFANSIVAHNCLCDLLPVLEENIETEKLAKRLTKSMALAAESGASAVMDKVTPALEALERAAELVKAQAEKPKTVVFERDADGRVVGARMGGGES